MSCPISLKGSKTPQKGDQVITKFFTPKSAPSHSDNPKSSSCTPHTAEKRSHRRGSDDHLIPKKLLLKSESGGDSKRATASTSHVHRHHKHSHHRRHLDSETSTKSHSSLTPDKRSRSHSGSSETTQGHHHKHSRSQVTSTAKASADQDSKEAIVSLELCDRLVTCDKQDMQAKHRDTVTSLCKEGSKDTRCDIIISDSDDDDLLLPPTALLPVIMPSDTPSKPRRKSIDLTPGSTKNTPKSEHVTKESRRSSSGDQCSGTKLTITLDMLLEEKKTADLHREELEEKGEELQEFIRQGGIENLSISTTDDELLPQHREQIKKLEMCRKEIMHRHPGDTVFKPGHFGCLFSFPDTLTLASCGFVPGTSFLDKQLTTLPPDMLVQFVCSGTVQLCFKAISCHTEFLSWTFQLLSIHTGEVEGLFNLIFTVLTMKSGKGSTWVPSVADVIRVFLNYGATFDDLCPRPHLLSFTKDDFKSTTDMEDIDEGQGDHQGAPLDAARTYDCDNLQLVVQVISHALSLRPDLYTVKNLMTLTIALLKVALDASLTSGILKVDFQACISAALNAFPADDWPTKAAELCYDLSSLTTHHHNRVHLVTVLPPSVRGRYLQRRLTYVMLQQLVLANSRPSDLTEFKVRRLFGVMQAMLSQGDTDFYRLSSLLSLINHCVGNETLRSAERDDLKQLTDMLRRMIGNVREYIHVLDRTLVKDIMVRLSNKWTFMLRDMASKQRSLFEWTQHPSAPPQKLAVEQVRCSQDETDTEPDQSEHTNVPCDQSEHISVSCDQSEHENAPCDQSECVNVSHNQSEYISVSCDQSEHINVSQDQSEPRSVSRDQSECVIIPHDQSQSNDMPVDQSGHTAMDIDNEMPDTDSQLEIVMKDETPKNASIVALQTAIKLTNQNMPAFLANADNIPANDSMKCEII